MFTKLKNLFKNSKKNQIKKLSLIVEELRAENDARASEIYSLKKALQECQDNQENAGEYDLEELQSKCEDLQDTLDNLPDFEDLESRIDNLEYNIEDKADVCEIDDINRRLTKLEAQKANDEKIAELKQIKSELKTMFENIVKALEE